MADLTPRPAEPDPQRVAGRYEVDRLIARGGMASVFLAKQVDLGRDVALKLLRRPDDPDDLADFDQRFRLEAKALAGLNHPHIVTLYDFGELPDGRCFLAMEYVRGPRMSDVMKDGPLDPARAVQLMLQVAQALRYAHRQGVIHRDLKPSNLLIRQSDDGTEHVKVVDFGLVKLTDSDQNVTRAGLVLGSPHCMSPEQVRGGDVDHTADIYAIGILLFRAVTGKYPFHGSNAAATMMAHLHAPVPTFFSINPDITPMAGLEEIVRRCLAKEPAERFRSMDELMRALAPLVDAPTESWRTGTFTQSTLRPPPSGAVVEPSPPRWILPVALGFGAVGLAIALWAGARTLGPSDPPPVITLAPAPVVDPPKPAAPVAAAIPAPPTAPAAVEPAAVTPEAPAPATPRATPPPPKPQAKPASKPPPSPTPAKPATKAEPTADPKGYKGVPEDW